MGAIFQYSNASFLLDLVGGFSFIYRQEA